MTAPRFAEKVALVVGGSRGIGFGIAAEYARNGAKVVLLGRDSGRLKEALDKLQGPATHEAHVCDVAHFERVATTCKVCV